MEDWILKKEQSFIIMLDTVASKLEEAKSEGNSESVASFTWLQSEYENLLSEFRDYYKIKP